ncbi:hypothetical protein K2173_011268 [Erythroxylum novogranatense]|uniref:Uncharacterized protein n=1 Tax=Erythroxylum novogranatense TaxID=1862640 RepID=A0AAV8S9A7_9ROSI|nr:hypothetical protein K2173_011268 [Erythroxylum novogranatense]
MFLIVDRLHKLCNKLEYHRLKTHQQPEPEVLILPLQAFRSDVSGFINQLSLNLRPGSESLLLPEIQQCFQILSSINKAFAKLVVDIDYPMNKWTGDSIDEYLKYSLSLLEFSNLINSYLSYLGQARLSLSHALSLVENSPSSAVEHLRTIKLKKLNKGFKQPHNKDDEKDKSLSDKEGVIYQALMEAQSIGFWAFCIVLSGLSGNSETYLEMRQSSPMICNSSSLINLDSIVYEVITAKGLVVKEIVDLNDATACLASATATGKSSSEAQELQRRLESFERKLGEFRREVDRLFSEILAGRNKLLDGIRI